MRTLLARAASWPVAWLLDRHGRPCTHKIMIFALLVAHWRGVTIPITAELALIAAAFGYTAWKDFIEKGSWGVQATESLKVDLERKVDETITRQIVERRDSAQAFEATP